MSADGVAPTMNTGLLITVNGEPREVSEGCTLDALLARIGLAPDEVATALNAEFVPRAARAARLLSAGDAVTCIRPITGG